MPPLGWLGHIFAETGRGSLSRFRGCMRRLFGTCARRERVELIVKDAAAEKLARKTLRRAQALNENVRFHRWPTNRVWTRDSGCAFVRSAGAKTPAQFRQLNAGPEALLHPKASSAGSVQSVAPGQSAGSAQSTRARTPVPPQPVLGGTGVLARATEMAAIKWRFNAWAKYPNWKHDEKVGSLMASAAGVQEFRPMFGKTRSGARGRVD